MMELTIATTSVMLSLAVQVKAQPFREQLTDQHWAARGPLLQCIYPFALGQIGLMTTPENIHRRVLEGCAKEMSNLDDYVTKNGIDKKFASLNTIESYMALYAFVWQTLKERK